MSDESESGLEANDMETLGNQALASIKAIYGGSPQIDQQDALRHVPDRTTVIRLRVTNTREFIPESLIVKRRNDAKERPGRFHREWCAHRFMEAIGTGTAESHVPKLYAANEKERVLILEDYGESCRNLTEPLLQGSLDQGTSALRYFAKRLARLHADTLGKSAEWDKLYEETLKPLKQSSPNDGRTPATSESFAMVIRNAGLSMSSGAADEIDLIADTVFKGGPFCSMLHLDTCPDNCLFDGKRYRLIDLEYAKMGSCLLDIYSWRMGFPSCWCSGSIPDKNLTWLETIYRGELASHCPAALDDRLFEKHAAFACAYWMIQTVYWHLGDALQGKGTWNAETLSSRILYVLFSFLNSEVRCAQMPALALGAEKLLAYLETQWPGRKPLKPFSCFADELG